jgi:hypothetical protein
MERGKIPPGGVLRREWRTSWFSMLAFVQRRVLVCHALLVQAVVQARVG